MTLYHPFCYCFIRLVGRFYGSLWFSLLLHLSFLAGLLIPSCNLRSWGKNIPTFKVKDQRWPAARLWDGPARVTPPGRVNSPISLRPYQHVSSLPPLARTLLIAICLIVCTIFIFILRPVELCRLSAVTLFERKLAHDERKPLRDESSLKARRFLILRSLISLTQEIPSRRQEILLLKNIQSRNFMYGKVELYSLFPRPFGVKNIRPCRRWCLVNLVVPLCSSVSHMASALLLFFSHNKWDVLLLSFLISFGDGGTWGLQLHYLSVWCWERRGGEGLL